MSPEEAAQELSTGDVILVTASSRVAPLLCWLGRSCPWKRAGVVLQNPGGGVVVELVEGASGYRYTTMPIAHFVAIAMAEGARVGCRRLRRSYQEGPPNVGTLIQSLTYNRRSLGLAPPRPFDGADSLSDLISKDPLPEDRAAAAAEVLLHLGVVDAAQSERMSQMKRLSLDPLDAYCDLELMHEGSASKRAANFALAF